MRELYYSDNRDLVKWATLVNLARERDLRSIIQVPYWRPEPKHIHFVFQGVRTPVPDEVWKFFRDIRQVKRLGKKCGIDIRVVTNHFSPSGRDAYLKAVKRYLHDSQRPTLLFLDPDTGIEPKIANVKHTTKREISSLWGELQECDWLVLYQHARRDRNWIQEVGNQLCALCGGGQLEVARSEKVGRDVALFCVEKCAG